MPATASAAWCAERLAVPHSLGSTLGCSQHFAPLQAPGDAHKARQVSLKGHISCPGGCGLLSGTPAVPEVCALPLCNPLRKRQVTVMACSLPCLPLLTRLFRRHSCGSQGPVQLPAAGVLSASNHCCSVQQLPGLSAKIMDTWTMHCQLGNAWPTRSTICANGPGSCQTLHCDASRQPSGVV